MYQVENDDARWDLVQEYNEDIDRIHGNYEDIEEEDAQE